MILLGYENREEKGKYFPKTKNRGLKVVFTKFKAMGIMKYLMILVFLSSPLYSFENLLFKPLTANILEPRVGALYELQDNKIRLDIGNSIDLFESKYDENFIVRYGVDFFTFSRLRSEGRFKFPVETADYFFGLNSSLKYHYINTEYYIRFRLSHISSHLIDGYSKNGVFNKIPEVYSREFVDLVFAMDYYGFRPYLGSSFIFSTIPKEVNRIIPELGIDYKFDISDNLRILFGYDFKLGGYNDIYTPIHSTQIGLLIKQTDNYGLLINYSYYKGKSFHGMFYKEKDIYSAVGFQIYFY